MSTNEFAEILRRYDVKPTAVAKGLGLNKATVSRWKSVPADRVLAVEAVTGISRHELRPDLAAIFIHTDPAPTKEQAA